MERSNHNGTQADQTHRTGTGKQGTLYPPPQDFREDKELIQTILIPLWEQWQDELIESGDAGQREKDLYSKVFAEYSGAKEGSPYTLMFLAFCGGVDGGIKLMELMEKDTPEEKRHNDGETL